MNSAYGSMQNPIPQAGLPSLPGSGNSLSDIVAPAVVNGVQGYAIGGLPAAEGSKKVDKTAAVLQNYFKNAGIPLEAGMADVKKQVAQGLKLVPYETSVMGFKPLGQGTGQVHFFTIGSVKDLADDMQYFVNYLKDAGITVIYDSAPAPVTTSVLQKMGAKVEQSDNPKMPFKATL